MKKNNHLIKVFFWIILGFIIGYVIHDFTANSQGFIFVPNAVLIKKPIPLEVITSKARLAVVLTQDGIIDREFATLGAALREEDGELFLIKKQDLESEYQLTPFKGKSREFFYPNAIGKRNPIAMQILCTKKEVQAVRNNSFIFQYKKAQIGAALSQSLDGKYINLISKKTLERLYKKPISLQVYIRGLKH